MYPLPVSSPAESLLEADDWTVAPGAVDERDFSSGRVGPYRLGPSVRRTAFGEVILGLQDAPAPAVVELDLLDALAGTPLAGPTSELMADLAQVAALRHRHVLPISGAGFEDGIPYVVRPHKLGRTLRQLLQETPEITIDLAAAVLFAAAEACEFLAAQGPEPGACAMGGFDDRDVFLGFDGTIGLAGLGLKRARAQGDDASAADLKSCFELSRRLDDRARAQLPSAIAGAGSIHELARAVRRRFPSACAESAQHVGCALRKSFPAAIAQERKFFGLSTLQ